MSTRSRMLASNAYSLIGHRQNTSLMSQKDDDGYAFDDDEDLKSKYLEKELALKRINDELEKKTSEIFKKIEKYRYHESPHDRNYEIGQGDACSFSEDNVSMRYGDVSDFRRPKSASGLDSGLYSGESYFSRDSSVTSSSDLLKSASSFMPNYMLQLDKSKQRPSTAMAYANTSSIVPHTESSLRRAETARPIEGLEEKHQVRLQKATESVLKCVQSKLVNYEQRLADMHLQYRQKIQENTMLEAKVKALEEDRRRLLKSVQSLQSTTDKISKSAENSKMNLNVKAQAFASLKKEMDSLKRDLKQKNGMIQSLQTRLDRCTDENKRLRSQNQSAQLSMKQQHNEDRTTMEELKQRIAQLEQQKSSFQTALEKQAQLVKSLRNQKVHLANIISVNKLSIEFGPVDEGQECDP